MGIWRESDLGYDESLIRFMRCGLTAKPAVWGNLAKQYEILAPRNDRPAGDRPGG